MSDGFSRRDRDDVRAWRDSVDLGWERRERLDAIDDRWVREGEFEPPSEDESGEPADELASALFACWSLEG